MCCQAPRTESSQLRRGFRHLTACQVDSGKLRPDHVAMVQRMLVTVTDDLDGSEGAETISFAYRGRAYEIDLGEKSQAKFDKAMAPFLSSARRVSSGTKIARPRSSSDFDLHAIRTWAHEQGYEVASRGRVAAEVVEAYQAAH
jgi:hypothetical protein